MPNNPLDLVAVSPENVLGVSIDHLVSMDVAQLRTFIQLQKGVYARMYRSDVGAFPDDARLAQINGAIDTICRASDSQLKQWQNQLYTQRARAVEDYGRLQADHERVQTRLIEIEAQACELGERVDLLTGELNDTNRELVTEKSKSGQRISALREENNYLNQRVRHMYNFGGTLLLLAASIPAGIEVAIQTATNTNNSMQSTYDAACAVMCMAIPYLMVRAVRLACSGVKCH